jgi:hypothetical protein
MLSHAKRRYRKSAHGWALRCISRGQKKTQSPGLFRGPHLTDLLGVEAQGVEKHGVVEGCSAIREHPFKEHNVAEGIAERRSCGCVERFQRFEEAVHARYASERDH